MLSRSDTSLYRQKLPATAAANEHHNELELGARCLAGTGKHIVRDLIPSDLAAGESSGSGRTGMSSGKRRK